MYQKKVLFSNIIMQSSGTGSFPKTYFSTLAAEKMQKINPTKQSGVLRENYFFLKVHEKIRLFNPTNALIAKHGRYVINSNPPVPDYSK